MRKISKEIGPTKILLISLIAVIIIGAFLLKLPICNNYPIKIIDSIFVATSATCVTGLTTIVPIEQFTIIGQVILLALIQIGGIGLMTLISVVKGINCHINLIPVNPIKERDYRHSSMEYIRNFQNILEKNGINATIRREMGADINAACGQLRKSYMEEHK